MVEETNKIIGLAMGVRVGEVGGKGLTFPLVKLFSTICLELLRNARDSIQAALHVLCHFIFTTLRR